MNLRRSMSIMNCSKAKGFTPLADTRVVKLFQFEEGHAKVRFIDVSTIELQKISFLVNGLYSS